MTDYYAPQADRGYTGTASCQAGEVRRVRGVLDLADTGAVALNDVLHMCWLPGAHVPVDVIVNTDELDTGADAIVVDAGVTDDPDGSTEDADAFISGSTVGQAGGLARMDQVEGARLAPVNHDRRVGLTVTTGPGTGATSGKIYFDLLYTAAEGRFPGLI